MRHIQINSAVDSRFYIIARRLRRLPRFGGALGRKPAGQQSRLRTIPRGTADLCRGQPRPARRIRIEARHGGKYPRDCTICPTPRKTYPDQPFDSLLDAWPESEMLRQIVDRLNQWLQDQQAPAGWVPDPMIGSLPEPMAELPQVKDLAAMDFSRFDGYALREAAWLRDVSKWTGGDTIDELQRAGNIFDWMVRNIQIEDDYPDRIPMFPWETLLFGRGTADERAWLFILLLRQAKIDAALLAIDEQGGEKEGEGGKDQDKKTEGSLPELPPLEKTAAEQFRPWCVGALIDGKAYLFDPRLGLPIPPRTASQWTNRDN